MPKRSESRVTRPRTRIFTLLQLIIHPHPNITFDSTTSPRDHIPSHSWNPPEQQLSEIQHSSSQATKAIMSVRIYDYNLVKGGYVAMIYNFDSSCDTKESEAEDVALSPRGSLRLLKYESLGNFSNQATPNMRTAVDGPRLRRSRRNISCLQTPYRMTPRSIPNNSPVPTHSTYMTARSSLHNTSFKEADSILQALDPDSSSSTISERLAFGRSILSVGHGSELLSYIFPSFRSVGAIIDNAGGSEGAQIPVPFVTLTCPTPLVPQSPVFVPQSPITVSKFVSAASSSVAPRPLSSLSPIPALPTCGRCGQHEFAAGLQCRDCDKQWLACKVWYQANDGGKKQHLTEPYIRPAESNASNRAMLDALGVPGGSPSPLGLGIEFAEPELLKKKQSQFARVSRLLTLGSWANRQDAEQADDEAYLNTTTTTPAIPLQRSTMKISNRSSERFWTKFMQHVASFLPRIDPTKDMAHEDNRSLLPRHLLSLDTAGMEHTLFIPCGCRDSAATSLMQDPCYWNAKFVQHLAAHLGSLLIRL